MRKTNFLCAAAVCGLFAFGAEAHAGGLLGGAGGLTGGLGGSVGGLTGSAMGHGSVAGNVTGAVSRPGALDSINAEQELRKAERAARKAKREAKAAAARADQQARAHGKLNSYADLEDGTVKTKSRGEGSVLGSSDLLGSAAGMARVTGGAMANEDGARAKATATSRGTGTISLAPDTGRLVDSAYETAGQAKAKARAARRQAEATARNSVDTVRGLKPDTSISVAGSASASGSGAVND